MVNAKAKAIQKIREIPLRSNPFYWSEEEDDFMAKQMGNATVHCDIGNTKSGVRMYM